MDNLNSYRRDILSQDLFLGDMVLYEFCNKIIEVAQVHRFTSKRVWLNAPANTNSPYGCKRAHRMLKINKPVFENFYHDGDFYDILGQKMYVNDFIFAIHPYYGYSTSIFQIIKVEKNKSKYLSIICTELKQWSTTTTKFTEEALRFNSKIFESFSVAKIEPELITAAILKG